MEDVGQPDILLSLIPGIKTTNRLVQIMITMSMDNLLIIRIKTIIMIMIMKYHLEIMAMKIKALITKSIKKTYQIIKTMKSQSQETLHKMKTRMVRHLSEVAFYDYNEEK